VHAPDDNDGSVWQQQAKPAPLHLDSMPLSPPTYPSRPPFLPSAPTPPYMCAQVPIHPEEEDWLQAERIIARRQLPPNRRPSGG